MKFDVPVSVSTKVGYFAESVIREMTRLSEKYGAINLAQGMPDFDPPIELVNAATDAIRKGFNQYPITWGQPRLREAIARKVKAYNGIDASPEENVTVTCGSTEAVASAIFALTDPGDLVLLTDPYYENYVPNAILAQCKLLHVPFTGSPLRLDEERLKEAMGRHPKLIVLTSPNNPTGKVLDRDQLQLIANLCEEYGTMAVTDEIYEHILYDEKKHVSLATVGNMHERTVTVSGASKTYGVTGWRVGWAIAEGKLTDAIRKVHDYLTIGAPTPLQEALVTALNFPQEYYRQLGVTYGRKRTFIMKTLDKLGLRYIRPEGAYYILVESPNGFNDGHEFADHLLETARVAVLPADVLYANKTLGSRKIRLAYCKNDATLEEVAKRLNTMRFAAEGR